MRAFAENQGLTLRWVASPIADPNEPLGGIILVPPYGIPIIHRVLMMKIMITFANSYERRDDVVTGSVLVIEGRFSEPVGK